MAKIQVLMSAATPAKFIFEATTWQIDALGVLTIEGEKLSESGPVKYTHVASFNAGSWRSVERLAADE